MRKPNRGKAVRVAKDVWGGLFYSGMHITFWGAAQTVTGSMHLCDVGGKGYLLDCGQFQGRRRESAELNKTLPFAAADVAAVLLSHAHIDHSGSLPLLVTSG